MTLGCTRGTPRCVDVQLRGNCTRRRTQYAKSLDNTVSMENVQSCKVNIFGVCLIENCVIVMEMLFDLDGASPFVAVPQSDHTL